MIRLVYPTDPNFGDAMSPLIVEKLSGQKVVSSGMWNADMMAVGSVFYRGDYIMTDTYHAGIMRRLKAVTWDFRRMTSKPVLVWGSGFLQYPSFKHPHIMRRLKVLALRGLYTRRILEKFGLMSPNEKVAYGDPGLLFAQLFGIKATPMYDIGIVPHYYDEQHGWGQRIKSSLVSLGVNALTIDVRQDPSTVVSAISKCKRIVSSSLHGLIVADSLGIPNSRIELSTLSHSREDYELKFRDYYSAFGGELPKVVTGAAIVDNPGVLLDESIFRLMSCDKVKVVQSQLIDAFPLV